MILLCKAALTPSLLSISKKFVIGQSLFLLNLFELPFTMEKYFNVLL